ncbi:MAG: hypothetical protein U0Z53_19430 [Blastocatellia bacterium]
MNLPTVWLCSFVGIAFFVLTAWLDGQDVERFAGTENEYSVEGERLLWLRITIRQLAAFALVMMLDAVFVIIAEAEGTRLMEASRLFLGLAEGTNLLRLHYYYRLIRQAEQRARLSQAWRGSRQ